jgi:hypothetical protein
MTRTIRFSLLTDGSSDRCLLILLRWLIGEAVENVNIESHWVDFRHLSRRPEGLTQRLRASMKQYPSDILFVHRDAEGQPWQDRIEEIRGAAEAAGGVGWIAVVPVRMTEAWLLVDEDAIRLAADNPRGTVPLGLPAARVVESDADPKETLRVALVTASEKRGRRLRRFRETISQRIQRVAELMTDYSGLQEVPSFQRLRADTGEALRTMGAIEGRSLAASPAAIGSAHDGDGRRRPRR